VSDQGSSGAREASGAVGGRLMLRSVVDGLGERIDPAARPVDLLIDGAAPPRRIDGEPPDGVPVIDGCGLLALPGFTDLYARLREPGPSRRGTLASECRAALAGGFTRVCAAPDTEPAIDSTATVELVLRHAAAAGGARVLPIAALTVGLRGEAMAELATLQGIGCVAAGQGDAPLADTRLLRDAMAYAAGFDIPLIMRAQDARIGIHGCAHDGEVAMRLGLRGIPVSAETIALARLIELVHETGARVHVSRLSSARAVAQVREAKAAGLPISADVGIAHLHFTERDLDGFDARFASAVPFRTEADRDALRGGVADGTIEAICSDHAPLDADALLAPFPQVEPGLATFDRFLPMLLALPEVAGIPLQRAVEAVTRGPAKVLGLPPLPGDVVLVDVGKTVDPGTWWSAGVNLPVLDEGSCTGSVARVMMGGREAVRSHEPGRVE